MSRKRHLLLDASMWTSDLTIRALDLEHRGALISLICLAHELDNKGFLGDHFRPLEGDEIARLVGWGPTGLGRILQRLVDDRLIDYAVFCEGWAYRVPARFLRGGRS